MPKNRKVIQPTIKICEGCGESFKSRKSANRIYCSSKCSGRIAQRKGVETKRKNGGYAAQRNYSRGNHGWREINGTRVYFRSSWEANYARYLEFLKKHGDITKWEHEPKTFWFIGIKRGCCSYLPDFRVTLPDGKIEFHEVKGWMDKKSKTKIARMKKYHPTVVLKVFGGDWFKANRPKLKYIVPEWEK